MGNSSDTNIVKLYNMFNRDHPHQMHYYQRESKDIRVVTFQILLLTRGPQ